MVFYSFHFCILLICSLLSFSFHCPFYCFAYFWRLLFFSDSPVSVTYLRTHICILAVASSRLNWVLNLLLLSSHFYAYITCSSLHYVLFVVGFTITCLTPAAFPRNGSISFEPAWLYFLLSKYFVTLPTHFLACAWQVMQSQTEVCYMYQHRCADGLLVGGDDGKIGEVNRSDYSHYLPRLLCLDCWLYWLLLLSLLFVTVAEYVHMYVYCCCVYICGYCKYFVLVC